MKSWMILPLIAVLLIIPVSISQDSVKAKMPYIRCIVSQDVVENFNLSIFVDDYKHINCYATTDIEPLK